MYWHVCLLVAALVVYASVPAPRSQAADFACRAGEVDCLINAINMANANGQANITTLKAGTYTLTAVDNNTDGPNGLPVVTGPLTITGREAETTIIESAGGGRILNVAATAKLTLQRLTLRNGFSVSLGGGIFNSGTLTLIDCIVANNNADFGGGLFNNNGTVIINCTTFEGNQARLSSGGLRNGLSFPPLIDVEGGTVTIANSTFVHNVADGAGGIVNSNMGTMTLTNTTVARNRDANNGGGGILNVNGIVLLQNTILARNDADVPGQIAPSDCTGPVTSLGNNLIGNPTFTGCTITLQPTDLTGDPGLGTFTDNGTPGNGHFPLLSSSQAIDAGNNAVCFRRDQLGEAARGSL